MPDLSYYTRLITSQYQASPKALAWLSANLQLYQDALACLRSFGPAFDLDLAAGAQLEVLGQIVGVGRVVDFQPSGGVSPVLDDATYRLLLKARIARNYWDGRMVSLLGIWSYLFPGGLLQYNDHQDMTVTLFMAGSFTSIIKDLIDHDQIFPRPQGVQYTFVFPTFPMLGFDRDDTYVAGLDTGHFI